MKGKGMHKYLMLGWLAGNILCGQIFSAAADDEIMPELTLPACAAPPTLDGRLDDTCWATAAVITNLHVVGQAGAMTGQHRVMVCRDAAWLYVGFRVEQPVLDRNPPTFRHHDADIQQEDNVQVSFDPGAGGKVYYQFLVSPLNTRADFRMVGGRRDREGWNIPWRSAAAQDDAGWSVEMALPLGLLMQGGDADKLRFNAVVDTRIVERDASAAQVGIKSVIGSWALLKRQFDEPEHFGHLRLASGSAVTMPFLPFLSAAHVEPYRMEDGKYYYDVRVELSDAGKKGGSINLAVEDQPAIGQVRRIEREIDLAGDGRMETMVIPMPVERLCARETAVRLVDAAGEVWQTALPGNLDVLDVFSAYLDRNYYTGEAAAGAVCRLGVPAAGLPELTLRAQLADGRELARAGDLQPAMTFDIPLADLAAGEHVITLELCRGEDAVTRHEVLLIKRAPHPAGEWKVDQVNRVLLRNGEPFFPFGIVMAGIAAQDDWAFRDVAEMGMNSIYHWKGAAVTNVEEAAADARAYLAAAGRHGLQVVFCPDKYSIPTAVDDDINDLLTPEQFEALNDFVKTARGQKITRLRNHLVHNAVLKPLPVQTRGRIFLAMYERQLPVLRAVADAVKPAGNLAAYNIFDEPNVPGVNQDVAGRAYYKMLHEYDGYHPVFVVYNTLWDSPAFMKRITDWCDVLVQDPYWVPAGGRNRPSQSVVTHVATMVARTKRLADSARRVTMTVPQAEFWSGCRKRSVSPAEQRCQTYLALIHGSKGIIYFFYPLFSEAMAGTMRQLGAEMQVLGPVCLAPIPAHTVTYSPGELDPISGKFTDVQVALRRNPAGGYVLLCANTVDYPVDAKFIIPALVATGTVQRLFGKEACPVKDHAFSDSIERLGTRAYLVEAPAGLNPETVEAPVEIRVEMTPHPEQALGEPPADLELDRTGKKNKLPNSSFEQATLPGWPDYYRTAGSPILPDERIGADSGIWGVDTNRPYHGKNCLRMDAGAGKLRQTYIEYQIDPALTPTATDFVLSAWMRANRDGVRASMYVSGKGITTNVALTTEWHRYALPVRLPAQTSYLVLRWYYSNEHANDMIWMDAAQLEAGVQATGYEP